METKKEVDQAIRDSIAHWERMIEWAKTQNEDDTPSSWAMYYDINESWLGRYCALCELFESYCETCPLIKIGQKCEDSDSVWSYVSSSDTWKEWLLHAEKMLDTLKSLQRGGE